MDPQALRQQVVGDPGGGTSVVETLGEEGLTDGGTFERSRSWVGRVMTEPDL